MKQSNTFPSKSIGDVLFPLYSALKAGKGGVADGFSAKQVILQSGVDVFLALDEVENAHVLISYERDYEPLDRGLIGLTISKRNLSIADGPIKAYIDLVCETGTKELFVRPFLKFSEDLIAELNDISEEGVPLAIEKTVKRWRQFWTQQAEDFSSEWLIGLFGELVTLAVLLQEFGNDAVDWWHGPEGMDHDFHFLNKWAIETKSSTTQPFKAHFNLHQLDASLFHCMYISCVPMLPSAKGSTLSDIVRKTEDRIGNDSERMDEFHQKLLAAGYDKQNAPMYDRYSYEYSEPKFYFIDENFPKIVESSFILPLDHRIQGLRYEIVFTDLPDVLHKFVFDQIRANS